MTRYLADKSALSLMQVLGVSNRLEPLFTQRLIWTCTVVDLEVLYSARSAADWHRTRDLRSLSFESVQLSQAIFDRALEVQGLLADRGHHRGPSIPDLIVAATAEHAGLVVLHYDADFDLIAHETGQDCEWVVERGSIR